VGDGGQKRGDPPSVVGSASVLMSIRMPSMASQTTTAAGRFCSRKNLFSTLWGFWECSSRAWTLRRQRFVSTVCGVYAKRELTRNLPGVLTNGTMTRDNDVWLRARAGRKERNSEWGRAR
jgi:hypothetical protein